MNLAAIRQEMKNLWKEAAAPGSAPVTRASLLNLAVWWSGGRAGPGLVTTIESVVQAHPARVLLMEVDPAAAADLLEVQVTAHCTALPAAAKQVCSEQLTLRASTSTASHLPGLVAGLVSTDLPISLFAPRRPSFRDHVFRRLVTASDHLIVDSAGYSAADMRMLHDLAASLKRTTLGDLNWLRLRFFRGEIAGFFDPPFFRPLVDSIERVETRGGEGSEASALLLAGWVHAVLEGRPMTFSHRTDRALPAGFLHRALLRAERGGAPTDFIVEADPSKRALVARVVRQGTCPVPRRTHPSVPEPWELVADQIMRSGSDPLYTASLARAASLP